MKKVFFAFALFAATTISFSACNQNTENATENAGAEIEEAGEATGEAVEAGAEEVGDEAAAAGEAIEAETDEHAGHNH